MFQIFHALESFFLQHNTWVHHISIPLIWVLKNMFWIRELLFVSLQISMLVSCFIL